MFCAGCGYSLQSFFVFCPSCGRKRNSTSDTMIRNLQVNTLINNDSDSSCPSSITSPSGGSFASLSSLSTFMKVKETERRSHFEPKLKKSRLSINVKDDVLINIGLMEYEREEPKRVFGKTFLVKVGKTMNYDEVRQAALKKWEDYDRKFSRDRGYVLVYPDGKLANTIPGSSETFTMCKYKEDLGKAYSRITLYLCPVGPLKESSCSELPISEYFESEYEVDDEYLVYDENNEGLQPSDVQLGAVQIEDDHDVTHFLWKILCN